MINVNGIIQGTRVGSISRGEPRSTAPVTPKYDEDTKMLAKAIPYWPEVISTRELQEATGLSWSSVLARISSCAGDYLVFSDGPRHSRLKRDLSNCDLEANL